MTKLLVIALDGATLDLLTPWMKSGRLPLLQKLFNEGAGGSLNSTTPWATPTAFATFATGTNPGKHGIFDFGRLIGQDYTAFVPTNGANIKGETLWRLLDRAGVTSGVLNMPMTYPAEQLRHGFVVAGIPYPAGSPQLCWPPTLLDSLQEQGWDLSRNASDDLRGSYADYFEGLLELVRVRGEATAWLIKEKVPDFVAVHFLEPDQVQHRFWQFMAGEPRHDPAGPHTDAILRLFQGCERAMSLIIEAAGDDATLLVMSDHGFGPTRQQVWLNNWLERRGYLALKGTLAVRMKKLLYRLGFSPARLREAAPERVKLAILQFFERQKGRALATALEHETVDVSRKGLLDRLTQRLTIDFYDVDWSRTRAFSTGTVSVGYVWLNRSDRDPQGIVTPQTLAETRAEIAASLRSWPPVGEVLPAEALWHGAALADAPDLVVRWKDPSTDARYFQTRFSSHHLARSVPNDYAGHRPNGMFVFHGPAVRPDTRIDADILDLAPTLLWLLDQPVPTNMDGHVLKDCFELDRPVRRSAPAAGEKQRRPGLSESDEAAIMSSLRNLGYIE